MNGIPEPLRAYDGDRPFAFVCYAHEDSADVFPLLSMLVEADVPIWFDEGISPGNPWRDELANAIDRCRVFLYFVTPASVASRNCQRECGYALDSEKSLLAVHLEETQLPRGLTLSLADQQAILGYRYPQATFERKLVEAARQLLGTATGAAAPSRAHRSHSRWSRRTVRRVRRGAVAAGVVIAFAAGGLLFSRWLPDDRPVASPVELRRLTDAVGLEQTPALSPNGDTIAFAAVVDGRHQVVVRLVAGGTPVTVTTGDGDHYAPRWAPDSSSLIYYTPGEQPGEQGAIWEVPALGGPTRRIASALGPGDFGAGGEIAFLRLRAEGGVELAAARSEDLEIRAIAQVPSGVYSNLRWSPNGEWLAYTYAAGGAAFSSELTIVPAGGGPTEVIEDRYYFEAGVDWLPDGSGFIASSSRGSLMPYPPTYNLWRIPLDDGVSTQLTFGEFSYEHPDVGVDGTVVASRVRIESDVWRFPTTGDARANALGGERLTRQTGLLQTLTIAPDETEVAFLSDSGGHANVWAARVEDGAMRPLTRETGADVVVAVPAWSPRGDWIAFLSSRNTASAAVTLWLVRPDGSDLHDLGIFGTWACWSPDGAFLYYTTETDTSFDIRKVPVDGGEPIIVRNDNAIACGRHGDTIFYARVLANDFGPWDLEIRAATPEDGPSRVLGRVAGERVPSAAYDLQPIPSPDGNWLAMPLVDGATTNLWTLSVQTGQWRQITDFGERNVVIARRIAWSPDGEHLYGSVSDVDSDIVLLDGLLGR